MSFILSNLLQHLAQPRAYVEALVTVTYSTYILERAIMDYFLELHDTRPDPREKQLPLVLFQSSKSLPQSLSLKSESLNLELHS